MAETSGPESQTTPGRVLRPVVEEEDFSMQHTPDVNGAAMKIQRAKEAYKAYAGQEEKPSRREVLAWSFYELCSYFIHTVLIPIVFPLIISQIGVSSKKSDEGWIITDKGLRCRVKEIQLYKGLTKRSIHVGNSNYSPLEWTTISWVTGLVLASPILGYISIHLDRGRNQLLIAAASIATGALFCLPAGFFNTTRIFPPYIAAIVAANTVAAACHTRHLGLMLNGYFGSPPAIRKSEFPLRKGVAAWLSLYSTAFGSLGSAIISAFTYHMLRIDEKLVGLWVVSIFSGLKWLAGMVHIAVNNSSGPSAAITSSSPPTTAAAHIFSIFRYPHAIGSLVAVFLSSFSTMCIFTGGILHLIGHLCLKPVFILYLFLTYFIFPLFSLPLSHLLQLTIKADAVKMQILGFLLSMLTTGFGFYYKDKIWHRQHSLLFAAIQGTSTSILYAFGRVLLLDCSPSRKEGAFSVWFSWVRAIGTCVGFAFASAGNGNVNRSFGVAFWTSIAGILVLNFGNVSNFGGAVAAGHIRKEEEEEEDENGLDNSIETKQPTKVEAPPLESKDKEEV